MGSQGIPTCRNILQRNECPLIEYDVNAHNSQPLVSYIQLICSVDPRGLRLTPYDDEIYTAFRTEFPKLDVDHLNEDQLKTPESKDRWRAFIERFNKLEDFSFGTIIRANADDEFNPDNSILVIRLQFWAIEIARNREGLNDGLRKKFQATQVRSVTAEAEPEGVEA